MTRAAQKGSAMTRAEFRVRRAWVMAIPPKSNAAPSVIGFPWSAPFTGVAIVDDGDPDTMLARPGPLASNALVELVKREGGVE